MCKVVLNNNLNGVELYFEGKPEKTALTNLKANGFRWNNKKLCWYAKQNDETLKAANELSEGKIIEPAAAEKKNIIDLWSLTQLDESMKNDSSLPTKDIAKEVRSFLKKRFSFVKFAIKTRKTGYSSSIDCDILESPFEKDSIYLNAIQEYCKKYINTYNWDNSDIYTDYYHVNFYGGYFQLDYDYKVTEATEEIKESMKNFDISMGIFEAEEKARQEKEYQEYLKQQEEAEKQYKIRVEEERKEIEIINNSVEVIEVEEKNQYYVKNSYFAKLNKNNTLDQYKEEVANGEYYLNSLKVTREIKFTDKKALELFQKHLLSDFNFIEGTGGSYTEDNRIKSMVDYQNMSSEEQKSVEWLLHGIAVYFNNELVFVIDSQGYSYARYVGLVGESTVTTKEYNYKQVLSGEEVEVLQEEAELLQYVCDEVKEEENTYNYRKNLIEVIKKNRLKPTREVIQQLQEEKFKNIMYRVIKETDNIQDQFNNISLEAMEGITIVRPSMIAGADTQQVYYNSHEIAEKKIKLIFKPKNNKNYYSTTLNNEEILIYKGWITLPNSVLYDKTPGGEITKYGSYDKAAMDDILNYLNKEGIKPIINTFKPVF